MLKTFKEWLEAKGISSTAFETKEASEMAQLNKEYLSYVSTTLNESSVSKEDYNALKDELDSMKDANPNKAIIEELEEKVNGLIENQNNEGDMKKTFHQEFAEKLADIKKIAKGESSTPVVIKADTVRASITNSTSAMRLGDIGQLGVKARGLYDIFTKIPVPDGNNGGTIRYVDWDEATTVRAADVVAEGGTFPESTATFQEYSIPLRKIGDTLPVSEEFGTDEVTASAELELFLDTNVESVVDNQIAVGDGTGQNLLGAYTSSPTYTPVASNISDANIYDLVKKVKTAIVKNRGSKYSPNFVCMNSDLADQLHLKKDANENYIFPDVMNIGAMSIVIDNNMADNTLFVGDSRFGRIYEKGGVEISRGLTGSQFAEDLQTIKARKRLLFLMREVDKTGFLKVTDVATALTTLATP